MQSRFGFPSKYWSQIHLLEEGSQCAPTPQIMPSHLCLHLPFRHTFGSSHGLVLEHTSRVHFPPGKGLPINSSGHLHIGPSLVTMHWAPGAHSTSLQTKRKKIFLIYLLFLIRLYFNNYLRQKEITNLKHIFSSNFP